jgi:hypothetical protein
VGRYLAAGVEDRVETAPGERQDALVGGPVAAKRLDRIVAAYRPDVALSVFAQASSEG